MHFNGVLFFAGVVIFVIALLMMSVCTTIHAVFMVAGTHTLEWRLTRFGPAKGNFDKALLVWLLTLWMFIAIFIEAFSGGILLSILDAHLSKEVKEEFLLASEGTGDTLALITWVIFGSAVVGQAVGNFSWMILLYSVFNRGERT